MKILKILLRGQNIEDDLKLIPAAVYPPQRVVDLKKRRRFRLAPRPVIFALTITILGLFFSGSAYAVTKWVVTGVGVSSASGNATYGTAATGAGAVSYTITLTESNPNGAQKNDVLSIAWSGGTPTGVTTSLGTGFTYTPTGNGQTITLTINTTGLTPAGTYNFTITNTDNNGGSPTTATGTLVVNTKTLTETGATAANKTYDGTTAAVVSGGTLTGVVNSDVVSVSTTGTFASANVGTGIGVTLALTGAGAANYTLTQPGITANITGAPLTITATGPTKTYGTTITTGTSTTNFTATGAMTGQAVTGVTLTTDVNGQTATTPVGTAYVVTPSAPTGTGGFLASNYTITYVNYNGTVTAATLTITATGPSLTVGGGFSNGTYTTYFVSSATAVSGETVTGVTLTGVTVPGGTAITTSTPVGTAYTITPSAATGSNGFLASNYTITYIAYSDNIANNVYSWTGASDTNWANSGNWTATRSPSTYPQTSNDDVAIGVSTYSSGNQPVLNASLPISSLTLGSNGSTGVTLTINSGNTLTISSDLAVNSGSAAINLVNNGAIVVNGGYTSNSGATLNASSGTGSLSIAGTYNNSGSSTFGSGAISVAGTFNNVGTSTFGSGTVSITGAFNNSGTTKFGSGAVTFGDTFTNSSTTTFGSGLVTFNSTAGDTFLITGKAASNSITFYNIAFTGGSNYHFKTSAGGGNLGKFNLASTGIMTLSNSSHVGAANAQFNLLSDASGSATIAALPAGCIIQGTVNVQRYIAGGVASARGYRLLSPPTWSATDTHGNNIYSISYLLDSTYISGTKFPSTATNSHSKTGNPSLYIYRENLIPTYQSFLTSNYRGIESLTYDPYYLINLDSDTLGTKYDIPVGNGYLFFFRGGPGTFNPFTVGSTPANATLTTSGSLNQGSISVTNWYNESLGQTGLLWTTVGAGDVTIQGMNLVGNPYPSTIDWGNNFSNTDPAASIYGPNLSGTIYLLNPGEAAGGGNYTSYIPGIGSNSGTYNGLIASGEGFFVQVLQNNATLTFTENAKTNTQALGTSLFLANKRTLSKAVKQQIRLEMLLDTTNTDETLISFSPNSRPGYHTGEDASYRIGTGKVNLASLSSDNIPLSINQLPLAPKGDTIRLNVGAAGTGSYGLKLETITGIPQLYDVWLQDAATRDSVNMRNTNAYNFTITATDTTTFGSKRFKLVLKPNPAFFYKLLSFDGQKNPKRQVDLTWKTQNEADYTHFTIGRSNDGGKTFTTLGDMISTGAGTYNFTDADPLKGDNQYYLKTVDYFGNTTISNIVDEEFQDNGNDKGTSLTIYPNPVVNTVNLTIVPKSQAKTTYSITISNSTGKVVKSAITSDLNWQNNVSDLLVGSYLVQVVDNKDNSIIGQTKFVKL
ncbi:MAG: T9SS type A sorting domain-containing protein [Bacteroidetes bacterium]|nr:T9SS type A sorting domain-containing protein [Bacteroidota bacterium]